MPIRLTRRQLLAAAALAPLAKAQSQLPLHASGLEHVGFSVPDPQKSAAFLGRIFDPQIFQEMMPPLRYYCRIGISYLAWGPNNAGTSSIDHFCATVENYRLEDMKTELKAVNTNLIGTDGYNGFPDADGIRVQLMATPGGFLPTIIASTRVTQEDPLVHPAGLDHVMLNVSDVDKSAEFYRRFFGQETRSKKPDRAWFQIKQTRLGLQKTAAGEKPHIDHFAVRCVAFDKQSATERLKAINVEVLPSTDEDLLRIKDYNGFALELRGI
jgi:catechol 2,3-dioxygenase-like lactoylglutathione lyase family enzyme